MYDIYTEGAPYGLYDGDKLNCRVVPVLIGQVTWRDGNPDCDSCAFDSSGGTYTRSDGSHGMYYARGSTDCASCGDTCTSDEVSATCLLDSLTVYVARERAALESALGVSIDSSILLSGEDFSSTTAGLAWMNGLCVDTWSGSIVEDSGSIAITAAVMAHELGHLLGMGHDEGGPNIMQAVMTSGRTARHGHAVPGPGAPRGRRLLHEQIRVQQLLARVPERERRDVLGHARVRRRHRGRRRGVRPGHLLRRRVL